VAVVDTLDRSLDKELDLRMEAAAAGELAERSAKDTLIVIPDVIWERTSRRVLTLNWLEGVKLTNPQALKQAGTDHARLAQTVLDIFLTHAMREGVFHADMHPGNLFRLPGDRLGLVDFGILGRLDEAGQRYLAEILWAFLRRDYQAAARAHFDAGYVPADFDVGDFAQALRAIGEPVFGKRARDVSMAQLLLQLFEVTAMFNMRLRPELVLLQKTMVTVEGVARTIYPDIDMWEAARPAVERYIRSGQGPRAALRSVYRDGKAAAALPARIPRLAEKGEDALTKLERGELSLSEDTLNALAGALSGRGRWARRLFWVAVGAGLVLVFGG
jgi:ubiquinone biosynthesis protein